MGSTDLKDFLALAEQHHHEEVAEAGRSVLETPRRNKCNFPTGGALPASDAWLARFYEGERFAREKKPGVFDHLRSWGPWMVSVDDDPLVVLDGMSQTATVCGGFAEDEVSEAYVRGGFYDTMVRCGDTTLGDDPAAEAFRETLNALVPELPHVAFVNGGGESIEKALALCRSAVKSERATRVLGFEGSFHGRTLMALHATYNPAKRGPFEIKGGEAGFAPFPVWTTPYVEDPEAPEGFQAAAAEGQVKAFAEAFEGGDDLLASELTSLVAVEEALKSGEYFAVIVEPMQSEGGDRYATGRFHRALRVLTRHFGVPLIMDEVQTGFGLGGGFLWHRRFELVDAYGAPDAPDAITFAKRAQVGVVVSRFEDPEPTHAHTASLVRGRIRAEIVELSLGAERVQELVRPRLFALAKAYPQLVQFPRFCGYACAFDLPSPAHLAAYLGQRFWRGAVVFGAGSKTVRYRLSDAYTERELDILFETARRSLSWLDAHPGKKPPRWEDFERPAPPERETPNWRIQTLTSAYEESTMPHILALEARLYEPARRDPAEKLAQAFGEEGVAVVCEVEINGVWVYAGSSLGFPLESPHLDELDGPGQDPMRGRRNTLYSAATSVAPEYHGLGFGRALKRAQLAVAAGMKDADGAPRYHYVTGRNKVGSADAMFWLNRALGAHIIDVYGGAYGDDGAHALYYRQPVGALRPVEVPAEDRGLDLASGLTAPLKTPPSTLTPALVTGPTLTKITICNYISPAIVRGVESVCALTPHHPHLYLANGRDETVDLAIRTLRWYRKDAQVVIGLDGGYVGHTSGAARSISDPAVHRQGPGVYRFPRVPHPVDVGAELCVETIEAEIEAAGGASAVFGIFVEAVGERSGRVLDEEAWEALVALRARTGVPLVLVESASACFRSGNGAFWHSALPADQQPDIVTWFGGGQVGFVHLQPQVFVDKPLTMVSTWAGDELSLLRIAHQLRVCAAVDHASIITLLDDALTPARRAGLEVGGAGLYRTIDADDAPALAEALAGNGVRVRVYGERTIAVIAPVDLDSGDCDLIRGALSAALGGAR